MYEIKPETLKTFITSDNIRLPRFQRKQTWDYKKNFELIVSVFKNYPIGVSILSLSEDKKHHTVRLLLDGRQRRNALTQFYEDPENVYVWAKKYIGFENSLQPYQITDKFWKKINEYLEEETSEEENENNAESIPDVESLDEDDLWETPENPSLNNNEDTSDPVDLSDGLELLLEIIKITHNKSKKSSGFTAPFDFVQYVKRLPYSKPCDNTYYLSSRDLKNFLDEYIKYCKQEPLDYDIESSFVQFLDARYEVLDSIKLKDYIHQNWKYILERIDILSRIDSLLSIQTIGLIEVKNLKSTDSQKIFNLINSKGSPLKAVEILSARPRWNVKIESPSMEVKELVNSLYRERMGIVPEDVVRWDLAATFLRRINDDFIIKDFSTQSNKTSDFTKELTLSFKILAGIYVNAVTKDAIDQLVRPETNINWNTDIDVLVNDIKIIISLLNHSDYFQYFKTWKKNLMDLTTDGIAMDFLILIYKKWLSSNKPMGYNNSTKIFQKQCFILWDRLIYEYVELQWKGSSDSKIKNNIENLNSNFEPITTDSWMRLLDEIFTNSTINGRDITFSYMTSILYHFYCLNHQSAPDSFLGTYDVDHIIPQALFESSYLDRKGVIKDNLLNLGLLPSNENISKGKKRLINIDNEWLKQQIEKYEFIPNDLTIYQKFSDVSNYQDLFELRKSKFIKAFNEKRTYLLNN